MVGVVQVSFPTLLLLLLTALVPGVTVVITTPPMTLLRHEVPLRLVPSAVSVLGRVEPARLGKVDTPAFAEVRVRIETFT